jgi:hypothetical protein
VTVHDLLEGVEDFGLSVLDASAPAARVADSMGARQAFRITQLPLSLANHTERRRKLLDEMLAAATAKTHRFQAQKEPALLFIEPIHERVNEPEFGRVVIGLQGRRRGFTARGHNSH